MSQPTRFVVSTDFSEEESAGVGGRSSVRTAALDALMSALKSTTDDICDNLALIQRDDGEILDGMVKLHTLSSAVLVLLGSSAFTIPATGVQWGTARAYVVKDIVTNGTGTYVCSLAHTSGTFATDLAAGKWATIFDSVTYVASGITFTPTGSIVASNVQSAIAEVDADLQNASDIAKGDALIGYKASNSSGALTGAAERTVHKKLQEIVSVKDFGAIGDGVTDDTAAISAALLAADAVYMPPGNYLSSGGHVISRTGGKLFGAGPGATKLTITSTTNKGISINGALESVEIYGFTLTRSAVAVSGAEGIDCSTVTIGLARIRNMIIEKHWKGLHLGPTDFSEVERCVIQKNLSAGMRLTNTATDGACQWSFDSVISQKNTAQGFLVESGAGPSQITLGDWKNVSTYANSGVGMGFAGSVGVPIHGVRINGAFLGEDGNSELYLDTYGRLHRISDVICELSGRSPTGPILATGASNIGSGVEITANNTDVLLTSVICEANSFNGFRLSATTQTMANCKAASNGVALIVDDRNGVRHIAGRLNIVGGSSFNKGADTSQLYGVRTYDASQTRAVGLDLTGNTTAPVLRDSNPQFLDFSGCFPEDVNSRARTHKVIFHDHFIGDLIADGWHTTVGSDPQCVAAAHAGALRGLVRLTAGDDAGATMALNGSQLDAGIFNWTADGGGLVFEARVKLPLITSLCAFLGFTDQFSALEMPFTLAAGDALTSNATDAVGFLFDTAADTDNWWAVGVANNVDAAKQNLAVAPAADTYEVLRIEVTSAGVATFFRNGAPIGSAMTGALTASVLLTPVFAVFSRTTAVRNFDVDYVTCEQSPS